MKRLPLKSVHNTRELGGYFTQEDKMTQYKRFLRSDAFSSIDQKDKDYLLNYGVRVVIDLRDTFETKKKPNTFENVNGVAYYNIQLRGDDDVSHDPNDIDMQQMYYDLIDNSANMGLIFKTMAKEADKGIIAYHCTAGKDRAGLVTAILFMIAGVDKLDIIANYQVSHTYITPIIDDLFAIYPNYPMHVMLSQPEWIGNAVDYINKNYGSVDEYLKTKGVTGEEIKIIKDKLVEE